MLGNEIHFIHIYDLHAHLLYDLAKKVILNNQLKYLLEKLLSKLPVSFAAWARG